MHTGPMKRRRAMMLTLVMTLGVVGVVGSSPGGGGSGGIGQLADGDQDGWFDAATNAAVVLTLDAASFPPGSDYEVIVDEVRFPASPTLNGRFPVPITTPPGTFQTIATPVATRVRGVSGFPASGTPFGVSVSVWSHPLNGPIGVQVGSTTRFMFGETNGPLPDVVIGGATLKFSVATSSFADPTPGNAQGDADADGVNEKLEAQLTQRFGGIFDPRAASKRDLLVVVGQTAAQFTLAQQSRTDLRSRFFQRGFNLLLDEGSLNGVTGEGGLMDLTGTGATATSRVDETQALAVRNLNVSPTLRANSYFALLAGAAGMTQSDGSVRNVFGVSIRGSMVMQNSVIGINDLAWYQAGVFMHEIGHMFGLCHPVFQDGTSTGGSGGTVCPGVCGAVPVGERSNAVTVMGAPADDPNFLVAGWNALSRPLDYSPGQWGLMRPGCGFAP